jgi:DNA processing protein
MKDHQLVLAGLLSLGDMHRKKVIKVLQAIKIQNSTLLEFWSSPRVFDNEVLHEQLCEEIKKFKQKWSLTGYGEYLSQKNIVLITPDQPNYPQALLQLSDKPLLLFCKGNLDCLRPTHVAVVGSRRPTRYGQWVTQKLVTELSTKDISIVSGFMVGIDYQAHQSAQLNGMRSVGVLGFGFGAFYPAHLRRAAEEFLEAGMLFITEYPPGRSPSKIQFPERNRIVAGLSQATVVVEAQEKSGSLITAQYALDNNRIVAAVPGEIESVHSYGTNTLIQQGALLIIKGADLLAELPAT